MAHGLHKSSASRRRNQGEREMPSQLGFKGVQDQTSGSSEYNAQAFVIRQILNQISTSTLVKVVAVSNKDGVAPVGYVDVQPLVNQLDGAQNAIPHGPVHHLPYLRLQGGRNAVILDPQVGDIGICIFADRDISSVKATAAQANPGSRRRFSMADGLYLGGVLNGVPTQYVAISESGIDIRSPTKITLSAPDIVLQATNTIGLTSGAKVTNSAPVVEIDGQMSQGNGPHGGRAELRGPLSVAQDVTAKGTSVHEHVHTARGENAVTSTPN